MCIIQRRTDSQKNNHSEMLDLNLCYQISLHVENLNKIEKKSSKNSQTLVSVRFFFFMLNLYTNKQHLLRVTDQANVNVKTAKTDNKRIVQKFMCLKIFCLKEVGCFRTGFKMLLF